MLALQSERRRRKTSPARKVHIFSERGTECKEEEEVYFSPHPPSSSSRSFFRLVQSSSTSASTQDQDRDQTVNPLITGALGTPAQF